METTTPGRCQGKSGVAFRSLFGENGVMVFPRPPELPPFCPACGAQFQTLRRLPEGWAASYACGAVLLEGKPPTVLTACPVQPEAPEMGQKKQNRVQRHE